jgi:asparagine synthase (glutamine-hydrolysing)
MCGICGIYTTDDTAKHPDFGEAVRTMTAMMARRGPDDEGSWADSDGQVRLGFRRLAILDLSSAGHQPMISGDGKSVIVFNGEMYNFVELRRELEARGIQFRSRTDTEVVVEALNYWGIDALDRFNGMFALAWYHRETHELLLARDHAGIKPLYYYVDPKGRGVAFASQYNCLLHIPWGKPDQFRPDVLRLYLQLHHIPPPYALFEDTYQLEAGHYLVVKPDGRQIKCAWWTLPRTSSPDLKTDEAMEALKSTLADAVRRQRIADVPLGVFLSGGIDSPLVTAIAREQTDSSLMAYTIGSPRWEQDETEAAATYAHHLDVDFRLHNMGGADASQMLKDVIGAQYEPFGDFSIFPTLLVSEAARSTLTVALSGDGGDELFWGYERPLSLLRNGGDFRWPYLVRLGLYGMGKYGIGPKRSGAIASRSVKDYYFGVNSRINVDRLMNIAPGLGELPADFGLYDYDGYRGKADLASYSRWVEYYGQLQRTLKKVDMASMYHSLEVRVPILDREVLELSLRIDPFDGMRNGTRKAMLRELLGQYVPPDAIPKPKRGFSVPLKDWLRGELRPAVEEYLLAGANFPQGMFDHAELASYCQEHLDGRADHKWGIWTLLSLQIWFQEHYSRVPATVVSQT